MPENVYLDTEFFIKHKCKFEKGQFPNVKKLVANGKIKIFTSQVTDGEVERHLCDEAKELHQNLKKASEYKVPWMTEQVTSKTSQDYCDSLVKNYWDYRSDIKAEQLEISEIDPMSVFEKYFKAEAPFSAGKKKDEFPDAFVAAAIKKYCDETGECMLIITKDGDFKKFAEQEPKVKVATDTFVLWKKYQEQEKEAIAFYDNLIQAHEKDLLEKVKKGFCDLEFCLEDAPESEVYSIDVTKMEVWEKDLIDYDAKIDIVTISLRIGIEFTAYATFSVEESGYRDPDDKEIYYREHVDTGLPFQHNIDVTVEVNGGDPLAVADHKIEGVSFDDVDYCYSIHLNDPYEDYR